MTAGKHIAILGVFVADTAYRAARQPRMGETILGNSFVLGPGGKGSNQSVAAARLGADVRFITRLGEDTFGEMAMRTWHEAGVKPAVARDRGSYTGAAYIFIDDATGDNAIIVCPGAARNIDKSDIEANSDIVRNAAVFVTQLEQPIDAALHALKMARNAGVTTVLNPAPAAPLDPEIFGLCDFITPNESETEELTGMPVGTIDQAKAAADKLLDMGVGTVILTLGENGALIRNRRDCIKVDAYNAGPVVETTGAGDAFNGGFAVALSEGKGVAAAVRFGCATAGISVTRAGTAPSMPARSEVEALLGNGSA